MSYTTLYGINLNVNHPDVQEKISVFAVNSRVLEKDDFKTEMKWNIYPNPVENILYITGLEGSYIIKIVDAVGQIVTSIKGTSTELELDMSGKPAGLYLLKIESQGRSVTRKLIKK